jgi:uncharacterized protein (TIRG00374 family)
MPPVSAPPPSPALPARSPASRARRFLTSLLGIVVSVALLVWSFRGVKLHEFVGYVRAAHLGWLLLAVATPTFCFVLRAIRWRLLLRRDDGGPVAWGPLWHATAIGFMANNVLPLRAGEVLRCIAVSRLGGTRITAALSSVAVERIFDGLTVILLLAVALLSPGLSPSLTVGGISVSRVATGAGLVSVAALAMAGAVVAWPLVAERLVRRLVPVPTLADRLVALIDGVRHGLAVLRSPARLAGVVVWSLVHWVVNGLAFYLAFRAFDLPVNFAGALLVQGLLIFGIAVPSTPGFAGVFEAVIVATLALYGIDNGRASAYAVTYHLSTFLPITLLGLWSIARTPVGLRSLRPAATTALVEVDAGNGAADESAPAPAPVA